MQSNHKKDGVEAIKELIKEVWNTLKRLIEDCFIKLMQKHIRCSSKKNWVARSSSIFSLGDRKLLGIRRHTPDRWLGYIRN